MSLARSYASALYQAATEMHLPSDEMDALGAQLQAFASVVGSSKEARVALMSPATPSQDKVVAVQAIAQKASYSKLVRQFLTLLARKERLSSISEIASAFGEVRMESEGGVMGRVVSADPINPTDLTDLAKAFSQKLGKRVGFHTATDAELLAGMKVTVNGVTYDGTLRSQLHRLRDQMVSSNQNAH